MTTTWVVPLISRSRDRTGFVTTVPLYCSLPPTVITTWYESTLARPLVISLRSNDGIANGRDPSGASVSTAPVDGTGAAVVPLVPPLALGAPDAVPPPQAARTSASGMNRTPARPTTRRGVMQL